jgi:predicted DNA-binding protein
MSLILNLPQRVEEKLREVAADVGIDPSVYAEEVIEGHLRIQFGFPDGDRRDYLAEAIERMTQRTPEEKAAMEAEALERVRPGRPLPPGKTIFDVVWGKWPGDETDEQVEEALRRLS